MESPIPRRSTQQQYELTQRLLVYPTLAERLRYLLENESYFYVLDQEHVVDPEVIASAPKGLKRKLARVPVVANWVRLRTGHSFTKQALYQFRDGDRLQPRAAITNGLEEFWRLQPLLLDPTVPASRFEDPQAGATELDPLERRTYQLMNEVGFVGVRPREVKHSLEYANDDGKRAFLQILEGIARDQRSHQDAKSSPEG
ncbi:hypothetical protein [Amycolatopsis anabasis]|uniref:hypothetical protein n=1 Tax=Amycolatopsis anabasis TaxID=1840409 RepID=UPI00131C78E8|nr:hypothetical protein [Amycolatopsis anabasis]